MLNNVCIMGRLTADPEYGETYVDGVPFVKFSLAIERDFVDKATGKREPDYIKFMAWRGLASWAAKFLAKGKMVVVNGALRSESWLTTEGIRARKTYVLADNIYFTGSKQTAPLQQDLPEGDEAVSEQTEAMGADPEAPEEGEAQEP